MCSSGSDVGHRGTVLSATPPTSSNMTIDAHGNLHERDGKFGPKFQSDPEGVTLPATTWTRQEQPLGEIKLTTLKVPISSLMYERDQTDLDAPYQRGSVWSDDQRRNLIKSVLMGVPLGAIVRSRGDARTEGNLFRVVDGKQRIESIFAFTDGDLDVPADWFPDGCLGNVPADGMVRWEHLSQGGQRAFANHGLTISEFEPTLEWTEVERGTGTHGNANQFTVRHRTPEEITRYEAEVYVLINSAGSDQTDEDMERARSIASGG
jgi:hypothetical protein